MFDMMKNVRKISNVYLELSCEKSKIFVLERKI